MINKGKIVHIPLLSLTVHKKPLAKKKTEKKVWVIETKTAAVTAVAAHPAVSVLAATDMIAVIAATDVSEKGKLFIKSWEQGPAGNGQPALEIYDDNDKKYKSKLKSLGGRPKGYWTIGYGHLLLAGENYDKGISLTEAEKLFENDLKKKSIDIIKRLVTTPLNQQQFDALASYVFNTGSLKGTRLLANINSNKLKAAAKEMDIKTSGGKVMRGLVIRRENEQNIWLNGIFENHK